MQLQIKLRVLTVLNFVLSERIVLSTAVSGKHRERRGAETRGESSRVIQYIVDTEESGRKVFRVLASSCRYVECSSDTIF